MQDERSNPCSAFIDPPDAFTANAALAPVFTRWITNTDSCASQISQWAALEAISGRGYGGVSTATLTTVLLVSVYRTAASLEAAWKYFILCGVGIAQALFGTVLLYMAAEKVIGERTPGMPPMSSCIPRATTCGSAIAFQPSARSVGDSLAPASK